MRAWRWGSGGRWAARGAACALSGLLAAPATAALAATPAPPAPEMVLQDDAAFLHRPAAEVAASMDRLVALGVDRVRLTANWSSLTRAADSRVRPPDFDPTDPAAYEQPRWAALDTAVRLARARRLKLLIDVGFWAPVWATADATGPRARTAIDARDFADFAVAIARRYSGGFTPPPAMGPPPPPVPDQTFLDMLLGGHPGGMAAMPAPEPGVALPSVDEVALWNEPNHPAFVLPQWMAQGGGQVAASPAIYRRMVLAAYPAVKRVRPHLRVLIGNTSSVGGARGSGAVPPLEFLRDLACVDVHLRPVSSGGCASFHGLPGDGWAQHPYTLNQAPTVRSTAAHPDDARLGDLPRLATLLDALAAKGRISARDREIHLTEFGYETHAVGRRPGMTQLVQAQWLPWAEEEAGRVPTVVAVAQFLLGDQAPSPIRVTDSASRPFGQFYTGLLDAHGHAKLAIRSFTIGLVPHRRADGRLLLWGRLRGGPAGVRSVLVQRRTGGRWQDVSTVAPGRPALVRRFTTPGHSTFTRVVPASQAAAESWRLVVTTAGQAVSGLPVPVLGG